MKNNFGAIKSKLLKKVTELYSDGNKKDIKNIISVINENKDFKELYLFYEEIENLNISFPGSAELYIEIVTPLLSNKLKNITETTKKLSKYIDDVTLEENELYNHLDVISEEDNIFNIHKKVTAKQKLIEHLKKEKIEKEEIVIENFTQNEKLLAAILSNNFNVIYNSLMNENEKESLKQILSFKDDELKEKINEIKTEVIGKVDMLLSESTGQELNEKLNNVKKEVLNTSPTRLNYYKLLELKNGLG